MIATTLEQSKKLLELDIDADTADMYYEEINFAMGLQVGRCHKPNTIPAWSLSALLELMPEKEEYEWSLSKGGYNGKGEYDEDYFMSFETDGDNGVFYCENASNIIDAAFEMVCWLKENKYI